MNVVFKVSRIWDITTSIGTPGGSACEGVCIAAGVAVVEGACERKKENGVRGGAE
jgi:hypothetical protein